ncbi:TPA: hypothetical protein JBH76_04920 [Legionella pneumophila]|nr:hypothetical protein [Legionella pneumophila]HAT8334904.1 hypothetical protein [Legionella pneumophila]HAU0215231.1 hypothetical protein [Legionella pneumophila]HAU0969532.1 hypothetical protein [Legionella pneumophila]HAU1767707.1 hypothetical protein [Legionella pneumophila]
MNDILEQLEGERFISRFLNKEGLLHTLGLSENGIPSSQLDLTPTFLFRSLDYYRKLEDHRADPYENIITTINQTTGAHCTNTNLNCILVSCWSLYQEFEFTSSSFTQFSPDTVAVIQTKISDVRKIIESLKYSHTDPLPNPGAMCIDINYDAKVIYYSPKDDHDLIYNNASAGIPICFYKQKNPFEKEREYRFMLMFGPNSNFEPYLYSFRLKNTDYIHKIFIDENILETNSKLLFGLKAYYHSKIYSMQGKKI